MEEIGNKTIMCSVLFLDIVEYSKKPVSGQIALKDGFNAFLSAAIRDVPVKDRIILDTGDGAAISFMGDVEDALKAALVLREKLLTEGVKMDPLLLVRIGINLGPVRLVKDINGQPNIVGDGINVAQRIMGFANSGQILVSRSYYEAASRLSHDYVGMFDYQGSRTDKHVREHEVFSIGHPGDVTAARQEAAGKLAAVSDTGSRRTQSGEASSGLSAVRVGGQTGAQTAPGWIQAARGAVRKASPQQRALIGATFVCTVLLLLVVAFKSFRAPAVPVLPPAEPSAAVAEPSPGTRKTSGGRSVAETPFVAAVAKARVGVAVAPWGEVYLDGSMQGVSPPLTEVSVSPGKHTLEIRNTSFPPYIQVIDVQAGKKIKIKHKFAK